MNKKILTVLLVLAMMLSMVAPVAVFAEGTCEHKKTILNPNGNGTHSTLCEKCYATLSTENCTYGADNLCTVCSYPNPNAPAKCNHGGANAFDNGDGTHKLICSNPDCNGFVIAENQPHDFKDGVCVDCGAKESCKHENYHIVDNKNQTHSQVCDECDEVLEGPVSCIYVNGKCTVCKSLEPKKCEHDNKTYTKVDEKSHEVRCADCKELVSQWEAHDFVDHKCTKCGYEEPVKPCEHKNTIWNCDVETETHYLLCQDCEKALTEPEACTYGEDGKCTVCGGLKKACEHEHTHIVDNEDQTHSLVCDECDLVLETEPCVYVNGKCVICKSKQPAKCEHDNKIYTPVKDGKTHEVSCADCGETLKQWEAHDFVDHKCTKCGYEEPVEPCKHEHTIWVWNEGDGTHYLLCEDCADILTDPEACTYEDGVCTVCGGLENAEPDPDWDDVPKTGSSFLEWLYSVIF